MATYFLNQSNQTTVGTNGDDQFFVESGVNNIEAQGRSGNDEFQLFFGGVNSAYNFGNSNLNGNAGNDTIRIKINTGSDILANAFRGGQGNDQLLITANSGDASASLAGNLFQGGAGNDTVKIGASAIALNNLTINGNAGVDFISVSGSSNVGARVEDIFIGGGDNNDQIRFEIGATSTQDYTVNGGQGADRIVVEFANTATNLVVNGGTFDTEASPDGNDDIFVSADDFDGSNSIIGNDGNDNIYVVSDSATNLLIAGNAGNDTLSLSANAAKNVTIGGGNGNDSIVIVGSAGIFSAGSNSLIGGNGDDTIRFQSADLSSNAVTIQGGQGADLFLAASAADSYSRSGASAAFNVSGNVNFSYASLTDSTIDALDTIVVGSGGSTSSTLTMFMPQAVDAFNGVAGGYNFTAGILDLSTAAGSGGGLSLGQVVGTLDATLDNGEAVAFKLDTADTFGFVFVSDGIAGNNDDLLVRVEGATAGSFSAGTSRLVNAGSNALFLEIA